MKGFCLSSSFPNKGVGWLEIPKPEIQNPYDAILEPVAVSPCTSDVHSARANMASGDAASNLILGKAGQKRPDIVLGHEAVGRVVKVGSLVTDFKVGEVVAVPCVTPNWLTLEVQSGWYQHSGGQAGGRFTSLRDHGVFGEYFRIPFADMNLARIPEGVSIASGVLSTDMITTGFSAVEMAEVGYGDTVVVIGIGPVGLMSVAGAALRGAGRIIAVGSRPITRELAIKYGAETVIDYKAGDVAAQLAEVLGPAKADAVIVAGGSESTISMAMGLVHVYGRVANLLGLSKEVLIKPADSGAFCAHKTLVGNLCPGGRVRTEKLLSIVKSGRLDADSLITHELHGYEGIEPAFDLMAEKPIDLVKPIVYI